MSRHSQTYVDRMLFDDRLLRKQRTGIGHYVASLIENWPSKARVRPEGFFERFADGRSARNPNRFVYPALVDLRPVRLEPLTKLTPTMDRPNQAMNAMRPLLRRTYVHVLKATERAGYAGFFEPNPPCHPSLRPTITTMCDLSVLEMPEAHPPERVRLWDRWLPANIDATKHWICISEATASALTRVLSIPRERMSVVPLASRWGTPPSDWDPNLIRQRLGLPKQYLVYLGTIEPRKNVHRLLDAYGRQSREFRRRVPLLVVGSPGWGSNVFWKSLREHPLANEVLVTGYLPEAQAVALVRAASGMLYPSLYEGFGLPPLEAMTLGIPVAVSTAPSLREVVGTAGIRVDPHDGDGWADAMRTLVEPDRRAELSRLGQSRARHFDWSRTARSHHDLMASLVDPAWEWPTSMAA